MRFFLLISIFFIACNGNNISNDFKINNTDTTILHSQKLKDSTLVVLELADKKTKQVVNKAIKKVDDLQLTNKNLKIQNAELKQIIKVTKSTIIRDTIFITEKKNFWGKTKTSIDSSNSVVQDSIEIKN
jgi:hypothetical protein